MTATLTVTWLGVGRMGQAMVERLLDVGAEVAAWNRTPDRLGPVLARGAHRLDAPARSTASIAVSMVLDDAALDALWQAGDGLLAGPRPPAVWVDCSTVSVDASQRAAAAAADRGVAFVCAPVSGNPSVVRAGGLLFAASGPPAAIETARPVLDRLGRRVIVVGDGHQARVVKLCLNLVLAVLTEALSEALVLGESQGIRRGTLLEVINDSAVGSPYSRYKAGAFVGLDLAPAFTAEGQRKDLRLALTLAMAADVPLPIAAATEVAYSRLVASGLGRGLDVAALILLVAHDAGIQLGPEGDRR